VLQSSRTTYCAGECSGAYMEGCCTQLFEDGGVYRGEFDESQRSGLGVGVSAPYMLAKRYRKTIVKDESVTVSSLLDFLLETFQEFIPFFHRLRRDQRGPEIYEIDARIGFHLNIEEPSDDMCVEIYRGEWYDGDRNGTGVCEKRGHYERPECDKYEGQWSGNSREGYGVTTLRDGSKEGGIYEDNSLAVDLLSWKGFFLDCIFNFRQRFNDEYAERVETNDSFLQYLNSLMIILRSCVFAPCKQLRQMRYWVRLANKTAEKAKKKAEKAAIDASYAFERADKADKIAEEAKEVAEQARAHAKRVRFKLGVDE
ncbi:hypothetical protein PMAYCL1PPCAC_25832, partial [Pristionchus mayeri]